MRKSGAPHLQVCARTYPGAPVLTAPGRLRRKFTGGAPGTCWTGDLLPVSAATYQGAPLRTQLAFCSREAQGTRHKTSGALPHVAVVDFQSIFVGLRRFRFSVAVSAPGIRLRAPGPRTLEYGSGMKTHLQGKPPIVPQTVGHRGQTPDGSQISVTVVRHRLAPHRFPSTAILAHPSSPTRDLLADCLAVAPPPREGRG